ncbi:MAG TPA: hypothetical protein VE915_08660 [Actinomycetota bacterium]|nr:hypothetical protein [Actinomycetota bacterium]
MASQGGRRANEHKSQGALGVINREALGEEPARGMRGDDRRFQMESVHERCHVRREIMETVTLRRVARIAVAPLRQGEGADGFG